MNPQPGTRSHNPERMPHQCLIRLRGIYHSLKSAERKAADFLLAEPHVVATSSVIQFAQRAGCSQATVVRLAQRLGYEGYPELRRAYASVDNNVPYKEISLCDVPELLLRKVFGNSVQALQDTLATINPAEFVKAVDALAAARKIAFFGLGNAAVVAREGYHKFLRTGVTCFTAEDPDLQLITLSCHLAAHDVVVAISYSGESRPILTVARAAQARGVRVVAITNFPRSTLGRTAEIVLLTAAFEHHTEGEVGCVCLAQLAVLESLYVCYLLRKGEPIRAALASANEILAVNKNRPLDRLWQGA